MEIAVRYVDVQDDVLQELVRELDDYFFDNWGDIAGQYQKYHDLSKMACAVVAYVGHSAVGCGCWKPLDAATAEVKRMYVRPDFRRNGVAREILTALEDHAVRNGCHRMVLETGAAMPDAIASYERMGYVRCPAFGAFVGDEICVCMEKAVSDGTMR